MRRLELSLFADEVTEVPSETVVVLVPTDERPLRGDAARIDWRLDGQLSELLRLGYAYEQGTRRREPPTTTPALDGQASAP